MERTVQEYTALFIELYKKKLMTVGIIDPEILQTLITCLTLAAYEFGEIVKPNIPLFKTRGKYGSDN